MQAIGDHQTMRANWWGYGLWLFALALPVGAGLMFYGAVPFIRGLGAFVLTDAAVGVAVCALAMRVLYPEQWRLRFRELNQDTIKARGNAEGLAFSRRASSPSM